MYLGRDYFFVATLFLLLLLSGLVESRFDNFVLWLLMFRLTGYRLFSIVVQLFNHLLLFSFLLLFLALWFLSLSLLILFFPGHCQLFLCSSSILLILIFIFRSCLIAFPYSCIYFLLGSSFLLSLLGILIPPPSFFLLI